MLNLELRQIKFVSGFQVTHRIIQTGEHLVTEQALCLLILFVVLLLPEFFVGIVVGAIFVDQFREIWKGWSVESIVQSSTV